MSTQLSKLSYLGIAFLVAGLHSLISGLAGFSAFMLNIGDYRELPYSFTFTTWGLMLGLTGYVLTRLPKPELTREEAFLIGVGVWVSTPLVSALVLSLALKISYIDALFESVSGWTTTGLTVFTGGFSPLGGYLPTPDVLPVSVQFWRTLSQWIGGLGVLALIAYLLAGRRLSIAYLYSVEGRFQRISSNIYVAVRELSTIYVIFTIISITILYVAGMSLYDAIHHAMTGVATGGFSTHARSIGFYESTTIYVIALIVSFIGATSFLDLYYLIRLKFRRLLESVELKALLTLVALFTIASLTLWLVDPLLREDYVRPHGLIFGSLSGLFTVGFSIEDLAVADDAYKFLVMTAMMIGGSAFSTAGGIKLLRIVVIARSIAWEIESALKPPAYVSPKRVGPYVIDDEMLRRTLVTGTLYIASAPFFALILWISLRGEARFIDLLFESISAITGTGLSVGVVRAEAETSVKLILSIAMLLGRLEILAFLAALSALISKARRLSRF